MDYTWDLIGFENNFFNGAWKHYEESNGYTADEISQIKDAYVKGNTALFREIKYLMNNIYPNGTIGVQVDHETYIIYRVNNSIKIETLFYQR